MRWLPVSYCLTRPPCSTARRRYAGKKAYRTPFWPPVLEGSDKPAGHQLLSGAEIGSMGFIGAMPFIGFIGSIAVPVNRNSGL